MHCLVCVCCASCVHTVAAAPARAFDFAAALRDAVLSYEQVPPPSPTLTDFTPQLPECELSFGGNNQRGQGL
jgi:hypothetical protein